MKLSVIIPAYNVESYIERTLESLAAQSDLNFEAIIVDDGSKDLTAQTVQSFIDRTPAGSFRMVYQDNGGVSSARNRGIEEASGDYVLFLDGDDFVDRELVALFNQAAEKGPDLVFWKWQKVNESGRVLQDCYRYVTDMPRTMSGAEALKRILVDQKMQIWTASAAYRRELLLKESIRYTPGCVNGEDQEFTFKALAKADELVFIDRALSFYLERESSISGVYNVKKFDYANAFRRAASYMDRPELAEVRDMLLLRHMLENYFYNLKTCLRSANKVSIRNLLKDIDGQYPELNGEMRALMKRWKREKRRSKTDINAFLIAPELLRFLLEVQQRIIKFKSGVRARLRQVTA
ncbi:glycosyltransferase [Paenibacillus sp. HN-1]|uniref:glycosyltransferase family 2 protein n=1 Tax=Paenibacillus TaxID=44249 RepID=UPI001CA90347|nr:MULTISPECIES: glycosyltransferase family 2 protein [Paenibacillus]MBY9080241.1 glycosyltransferase [Paenibacillus sp. CGMCC 1.18879]MBY9083100.1 glycosyltransferase [Paenibacillus sinensis]